eukprot:Pgem_evm1s2602
MRYSQFTPAANARKHNTELYFHKVKYWENPADELFDKKTQLKIKEQTQKIGKHSDPLSESRSHNPYNCKLQETKHFHETSLYK